MILATIWSDAPGRTVFGLFAALWVLTVVLAGARQSGELGLRLRGFRESLWALWLALILVVFAVLCAAALKTLHYHYVPQHYPPLTGYLAWAFAQEFILQNLFFSRLLRLLRRPTLAIAAAGMMMSMAHLPNPLLVIATLLWGLGACWLFLRYRNLYVLALMHFLFGMTLAVCVPSSVQHNMRVGRGYSEYRPPQAASGSAAGVHTLHSPAEQAEQP